MVASAPNFKSNDLNMILHKIHEKAKKQKFGCVYVLVLFPVGKPISRSMNEKHLPTIKPNWMDYGLRGCTYSSGLSKHCIYAVYCALGWLIKKKDCM